MSHAIALAQINGSYLLNQTIPLWFSHPLMRRIIFTCVELPLLYVYMFGPSMGGYGFWEGKQLDIICSELTAVPQEHWTENIDVCETLVTHKFNSVLVAVYFVLYIFALKTVVLLLIKASTTANVIIIVCMNRVVAFASNRGLKFERGRNVTGKNINRRRLVNNDRVVSDNGAVIRCVSQQNG